MSSKTPTSRWFSPNRRGLALADEVRAAIPNAVDVVLDRSESSQSRRRASASSLDPRTAFTEYLAERDVDDPDLVSLFAEIYEEATP